jgi:hypothetical protein
MIVIVTSDYVNNDSFPERHPHALAKKSVRYPDKKLGSLIHRSAVIPRDLIA